MMMNYTVFNISLIIISLVLVTVSFFLILIVIRIKKKAKNTAGEARRLILLAEYSPPNADSGETKVVHESSDIAPDVAVHAGQSLEDELEAKMAERRDHEYYKENLLITLTVKDSITFKKIGSASFHREGYGLVDGVFNYKGVDFGVSTFMARMHEWGDEFHAYFMNLDKEIQKK